MEKDKRTIFITNLLQGSKILLPFAAYAAICAAVGAAIRNHSVHDVAIAYLAGASITGAIAGTVGMFTVYKFISPERFRQSQTPISPEILGLMYTTIVTAPIMAEFLVDNSSSPMETVADFFIGSTTIYALEKAPDIACYGWNYAGTLFDGSARQTDNEPLLRNETNINSTI